jgi:hypothetical protein
VCLATRASHLAGARSPSADPSISLERLEPKLPPPPPTTLSRASERSRRPCCESIGAIMTHRGPPQVAITTGAARTLTDASRRVPLPPLLLAVTRLHHRGSTTMGHRGHVGPLEIARARRQLGRPLQLWLSSRCGITSSVQAVRL